MRMRVNGERRRCLINDADRCGLNLVLCWTLWDWCPRLRLVIVESDGLETVREVTVN